MTRLTHWGRSGLLAVFLALLPVALSAAPFAAYVMDARTGEVLYEKNADTRLHPASLTKMMTLYIAFQAIESGEASLDTMVTVSANAAGQAPSRLGLRTGQKIALRYLIRGAAIKSANDAAAAIGDFLEGDEAHFAARMNRTAKALGMKNTTFKNANGLTKAGHLSTAHDMSILGRHLLYDFPQYYNLFSRRTADAGIAHVANTNRRFLDAYDGADGIKTGYTVPAGFNLTASAQRGNKRIIATVFGGTSPAARNSKMAELLDLGFERAPGKVNAQKPEPPMLMANAENDISGPQVEAAQEAEDGDEEAVKLAAAAAGAATVAARAAAPDALELAGLARSPRPQARPASAAATPEPEDAPVQLAAATPEPAPEPAPLDQVTAPQPETLAMIEPADESVEAQGDTDPSGPVFIQTATAQPETLALGASAQVPRNDTVILAALTPPAPMPEGKREVVARASSSGGRNWGISLGKYPSQYAAEQVLLKTALMESNALSQGLRKVATRKSGYDALFVGLSRGDADLACARLAARAVDCSVIGP
ncbi:D-alanyl-D-alanine carboxypeptidase [Rhodobacter capsulatus]|uniref:D-alanyl-D-alanine carboxypeptidase n=3 Tax=Rhodobacter capsulatus TaxID=1061 RepID=A0A0Q0UD33_RHOCA|nr:D-alanyl-D-alanine carboxypeptidase [Rhodobacter capsulatus]KQB11942.1 D-alanyl-D-alanine carboxypeptidase [Rhodobacter capsulatus]PZX23752.1 D-alanyl-D-alanine carboxypeptidase [Rhodobacter capsulatus]QNR62300.1 D-alanyl-D-alanine carboxypeptidase [Rhodobacter capsulatus]SDF78314.1 D-alanyl-D-alanine carboxypeptidase [Rhodobacter capsulatus]